VKRLVDSSLGVWKETLDKVRQASSADLTRKATVLTAVIDLDGKGGPVYAVILTNTGAKAPTPAPDDSFTIDGHQAFRVPERDLVWTVVGKTTLLVGNERGLQRQLRLSQSKTEADTPLVKVAARLRKPAPLLVAFSLSPAARTFAAKAFPNGGALVAAVVSGSVAAHADRLELRFDAEGETERDAIEHGVRAGAALLNAAVALLEGGAEATLGLDALGKRPPQIPSALEAPVIKGLVADWLHGAHFDLTMRRRRPYTVEATLKTPGPRPLIAALALLGLGALPKGESPGQAEAQVMLLALRQAQLAYKAEEGEFVACGPVPTEVPVGRVAWPKTSCFDAIGFRPPGKVGYQIAAAVEDGTLVMMARGDANGDGVPEVWLLDETSPGIEPFVPPKPDPNEP
jgi:hypothetical protein